MEQRTAGKVVVNFEGVVTQVDGDVITLDNGKQITISAETEFAGDPDTGNRVDEQIAVGNYLQGYTAGDASAQQMTAHKIYVNDAPQRTGGKIVIHFEGTIESVKDGCITLQNGVTLHMDESTFVTDAAGGTVQDALYEGVVIQGSVQDPDAQVWTAKRIHIVDLQ